MRYLFLGSLVVGLLLFGCVPTLPITNAEAVELATRACKTPHLVMVSEHRNIRADLLTLKEADAFVGGGAASFGLPLDTKVWLVRMDGELQIQGGPRPPDTPLAQLATATPPPIFAGTCSAVINATTGDVLSVRD